MTQAGQPQFRQLTLDDGAAQAAKAAGMRPSLAERFWSHVERGEGCWLWTGSRQYGHRYGLTTVAGKTRLAHRVAWELTNGPIPDGLYVCHRCDNPPCVRPDHLFLGTPSVNNLDAVAKRHNIHAAAPERLARGERVNTAKLTEDDVRAIRARAAAGGVTYRQLADEYGLRDVKGIYLIVNRRTWRHVE
jgi:hypothetical protein